MQHTPPSTDSICLMRTIYFSKTPPQEDNQALDGIVALLATSPTYLNGSHAPPSLCMIQDMIIPSNPQNLEFHTQQEKCCEAYHEEEELNGIEEVTFPNPIVLVACGVRVSVFQCIGQEFDSYGSIGKILVSILFQAQYIKKVLRTRGVILTASTHSMMVLTNV